MPSKKQIIIFLIITTIGAAVFFIVQKPGKQPEPSPDNTPAEEKLATLQQLVLAQKCDEALRQASAYVKDHDSAVDIWHMKGVCEHDLGQFDSAKASFQKVLAINPEYDAAKNYLKNLEMTDNPNAIVVTATETPFDRGEYESKMGVRFDDKILRFEKVVKRPSNIPEYLIATYTRTGSFNDAVSYLKRGLDQLPEDYFAQETGAFAAFSARNENEMKIVSLSQATTTVEVTYQKFK